LIRLIAALAMNILASNRLAPPPPETELGAMTDDQDHITALLIESPEPLPWRRIWQWISLRLLIQKSHRRNAKIAVPHQGSIIPIRLSRKPLAISVTIVWIRRSLPLSTL
jgi:hypothetical protein